MRTIVLVGGNEFREEGVAMDEEIVRRVSRAPARVLIVPTAAARERPELAVQNGIRHFTALGATASGLMAIRRADWENPDRFAPVAGADVIYLTGGDPAYLLDTIRGTPLLAAILRRCDDGAILVGSSAGAMVLAAWMRQRAGGWIPALGVVPGVAVIPHFSSGSRNDPMAMRVGLPDEVTVLGIAEATGCVWAEDGAWQVVGAATVTLIGPHQMSDYQGGEVISRA